MLIGNKWTGFYFQYLCEIKLADIFKLQFPKYGNAAFDGLYKIPFDFKSHAMNTSSHTVIINDSEAISLAIKEYGCVGAIIALGEVVYNDEKRTFQAWHEELKGGLSEYTKSGIPAGEGLCGYHRPPAAGGTGPPPGAALLPGLHPPDL